MKEKVINAPNSLSYAECVYGQLDDLLRTKPNMTTLAAEASFMFLNNKTIDCVDLTHKQKTTINRN